MAGDDETPEIAPVSRAFTGRSAQLWAAAELLRRGCNAAVPEVDVGTDLFAFRDDRPEVVRLQVKACATPRVYRDGTGYSARFALPLPQLLSPADVPPLYYVLAVLREGRWADAVVIQRSRLTDYLEGESFGSQNAGSNQLELTFEFRDRLVCSGRDLSDCRNAWDTLPPFAPLLPELEATPGQAADGGT